MHLYAERARSGNFCALQGEGKGRGGTARDMQVSQNRNVPAAIDSPGFAQVFRDAMRKQPETVSFTDLNIGVQGRSRRHFDNKPINATAHLYVRSTFVKSKIVGFEGTFCSTFQKYFWNLQIYNFER